MANPYPADIQDGAGNVRISGKVNFTDPDNQPGSGGSQPQVSVKTTTFDAATVLAIDPNTPATWPEFLPALTGQRYYQVVYSKITYTPGGTPYDAPTNFQIVSPNDNVLIFNLASNYDITGTPDPRTNITVAFGIQSAPITDWLGAAAQGFLFVQPQATGGDGTITVELGYIVYELVAV